MKKVLLFMLFSLAGIQLQGQSPDGVVTRWTDSFREWVLLEEGQEVGSMELRWMDNRDWTHYQIGLNGLYGQAKLKWPNRNDEWELNLGQEVVTIRAVFSGDPTEWRIIGTELQITFKARFPNRPEEWQVRNNSYGQFNVFTTYQGDPRDWTIDDQLTDVRISEAMRLAMVFIALVNSTPKG